MRYFLNLPRYSADVFRANPLLLKSFGIEAEQRKKAAAQIRGK